MRFSGQGMNACAPLARAQSGSRQGLIQLAEDAHEVNVVFAARGVNEERMNTVVVYKVDQLTRSQG